jgi:dihydroneopterin aldolase/2-amino-4-hydroxy-6-hydroxymethyldihydropteridine diphosphokinase
MDEIRIEGLEVFAYHGVHPKENQEGQKFILNVVLYADLRAVGQQDELRICTSYGDVCRFLAEQMNNETYQLIEAVGENLARKTLIHFPMIQGIDLEICKPEAPIKLTFQNISIKISRKWHQVVIGLGSNVGERRRTLENAVFTLKNSKEFRVKQVSSFRRTKPYGYMDQEDYLNGALIGETLLTPEELLAFLQHIEKEAGRTKCVHWGPRTLDLDILFYDDLIYDSKYLTIPHFDLHNRVFVLEPLVELVPYLRHPLLRQTMSELLTTLQTVSAQQTDQQSNKTACDHTTDQ